MSECKACCSEIDSRATKCPRCQAFQHWYRNPHVYSGVLVLPFVLLLFWQMSRLGSEDFTTYQSQFSVEKVSEQPLDSGWSVTTYKIRNGTPHKWRHLRYELVGVDDKGKVVATEWGFEVSWIVQPRGEAFVSVKMEKHPGVSSWSFRIADLDTSGF